MTLVPVAEVLAPVLMLASARPRREPFARRMAMVLRIVAAGTLAVSSRLSVHPSRASVPALRVGRASGQGLRTAATGGGVARKVGRVSAV